MKEKQVTEKSQNEFTKDKNAWPTWVPSMIKYMAGFVDEVKEVSILCLDFSKFLNTVSNNILIQVRTL